MSSIVFFKDIVLKGVIIILNKLKHKLVTALTPTKVIFGGFCLIILIGTILLSLPISLRPGKEISLINSFFTATSATCVTGLIRVDTYSHWSWIGQLVIIILIQIGGIGFMTFCIFILTLAKKKIGIISRSIMMNSIAGNQPGGIVKITKLIMMGTLFFEIGGAILLSFPFCQQFGLVKGIWFAIFHSISAFCNAGFDLFGSVQAYSSLTLYNNSWYINTIIMSLIVIGGLGFLVWKDILDCKFRFKQMKLHTKLVLSVTIFLIIFGALAIYLMEFGHSTTFLQSLFQSVSARTAGFNTINLAKLRETSQIILICLMLIGGSSGSTAGGIKTTTIAILIINILCMFKKRKSVEAFGRRVDDDTIRMASCVLISYLVTTIVVALIICQINYISFTSAIFESVSAIATVGLTLGITQQINVFSQILLALLMIIGRVGSLTLLFALAPKKAPPLSKVPLDKIQIG